MLICSGSAGRVNLEDLFAAGYLIEHLEQASPGTWQVTDTCTIARALYHHYADRPTTCLLDSQLGNQLAIGSMREELLYTAQIGLLDVVPHFNGQFLTTLNT